MQNKKGISDVVTTVLIVLLTIVAIAILWGFLQPLFTKSGTKVQMAEQCLTISLEVPSCVTTDTTASVSVKRSPGAANLKEVKVILSKPDGSTVVSTQTEFPDELETKLYSDIDVGDKATKVSVAAGIADAQGVVSYCSPTQPVNCQ